MPFLRSTETTMS